MSKPTRPPRVASCFALSVCAVALAATIAVAQQPTPQRTAPAASPTPSPVASGPAADASDLSITANVTARELLFEVVPNPKVEFTGRPRRDTVWEAERTNLPPAVQPGVTYRDIGIRLKITSVFADIERIVAEALGEIPASDDAPPTTEPNAQPPRIPQTPATSGGTAQVEAAPLSTTPSSTKPPQTERAAKLKTARPVRGNAQARTAQTAQRRR